MKEKLDLIPCLGCNKTIITNVEYKLKIVVCSNCNYKQKVRFYKNGKIFVQKEGK